MLRQAFEKQGFQQGIQRSSQVGDKQVKNSNDFIRTFNKTQLSTNQLQLTRFLDSSIQTSIEAVKNKVHQGSYVKIENQKFKFDPSDEQIEQLFALETLVSTGVYQVNYDDIKQYQPKHKIFCNQVQNTQQFLIKQYKRQLNNAKAIKQQLEQKKKYTMTPSAKAIKLYQNYIYSIAENIKLSSQKQNYQQNEIEQRLNQFTPNQKIEQMLQTQQFDDQYLTDLSLLPQNSKNVQITQYLKDAMSFATQCIKSQYQQTIINCPIYIPEFVTMLITNIASLIKVDKVQSEIPKILIEGENSDLSSVIQQRLLQQHTTGINLTTPTGTRTNVTNDKHYYEKYHFMLSDIQPAFFQQQNNDQILETFTNMINVKFVQQVKENSDVNIRLITKQNQQFMPPQQNCKSQFQIYIITIRNCNQNTLGQILFNTSINAQNANTLSRYFKSIQIVPPQQVYQLKNQFYKTIQTDFSANIIQSLAMFNQDYSIYTSPMKSVEQLIQQLEDKTVEKCQDNQNLLVAQCLQNQVKHNNLDLVKECRNELLKYERSKLNLSSVNLLLDIKRETNNQIKQLINFVKYGESCNMLNNCQNEQINHQFINLEKRKSFSLLGKYESSSFDQTDFYYYLQKGKQISQPANSKQQITNSKKLEKSRFGKLYYIFQKENEQNYQFQSQNIKIWYSNMEQMLQKKEQFSSLSSYMNTIQLIQQRTIKPYNGYLAQPQYYNIVPTYPTIHQNIIDKFFKQLLAQFGQLNNQKIVIIVASRSQKHQLKLLIKYYGLTNWYVTQADQISKFEVMDIKVLLPETNVSVGGQVYQLELKQSNNYLINIIRKTIQDTNQIASPSELQQSQVYPCYYNFIQNTLDNVKIIQTNNYKLEQLQKYNNNIQSQKRVITKRPLLPSQQQIIDYIRVIPKYILPVSQLSQIIFPYRIKEQPKQQYIPLCVNFINPLSNRFMPVCQRYNIMLQQTLKLQSLVSKRIDTFHKIKQNSRFLDRRSQISNFLFNSQIVDKNKYSMPLILLFQRFAYQMFQTNNFLNEILQNQQETIGEAGNYHNDNKKSQKIQSKVVLSDVIQINQYLGSYKKQSGTYFSGTVKSIASFYQQQKQTIEQNNNGIDTEYECNKVTCTERWIAENKNRKECQININSVFADEFNFK